MTVYVIDTGVRTTHEDFAGRAGHGWDFVGNDRVASDPNGHGTHVAGTVAGTSYGVAKRARIVSVRVLDAAGGGTTARVIAGIDWVTRHARKPAVANLSLGGPRNDRLDAAVRASIASGVTYTVAAGNDGRRPASTPRATSSRPSRSARPAAGIRNRPSPTTVLPSISSPRASISPPRPPRAIRRGPPFRVRRWRPRTPPARPRSIWPIIRKRLRPRSGRS